MKMAEGAALMTDTKFTYEMLGSAWPVHTNRPIAAAAVREHQESGLTYLVGG